MRPLSEEAQAKLRTIARDKGDAATDMVHVSMMTLLRAACGLPVKKQTAEWIERRLDGSKEA